MAYSAVIKFRNGIDLTATVFGMDNDHVTFTTTGLNALVAAGGLPTGVTNVNPVNGTASDTVAFCSPLAIRNVVIT
jgi:hypothetical protein